ncbi:transcriptional regulator, LacI family [Bifidobacterium breve 689b]|nr:transcriptional regulator, LacI family [Bifidobacterium breve 689b]
MLDREFQTAPPTPECGILCLSDTIAIGALHELMEHGIRIPEHAKLMGFDGIPFSECTNPAISTVAMDVPAMTRTVIDRMVDMIGSAARHELLPNAMHDHIRFQVIPRTSSANI